MGLQTYPAGKLVSIVRTDPFRHFRPSEIADIIASTIPPTDPRESAIVAKLDPGSYTVIVDGVNGTTGVGLVENYILDTYNGSRAANISTRGQVGVGDDALIGGFIVRGNTTKQVIIRALGPSLAGSTTSRVLASAITTCFSSRTMAASSSRWSGFNTAASGFRKTRPAATQSSPAKASRWLTSLNSGPMKRQ